MATKGIASLMSGIQKGCIKKKDAQSWIAAAMEETDMVSRKKRSQPVGTKSGWRAGVGQGLDESILQGGGVPLSFKVPAIWLTIALFAIVKWDTKVLEFYF